MNLLQKLSNLKKSQEANKYLKNTSWLFAEKVLRMIVGLFVGIWIARYLGPEQFGIFSYAQSIVAIFAVIATLGLDGIIVRELVKDESKRDILLGTAFGLKVIGALIVMTLLAITISFTTNDASINILVLIIASATVFQSVNVIDFYFQSKVLSRYVVYANLISLCISSVIKVILILKEAPLVDFAWVVLFDSFVLAAGFIYFYRKNNLSIKKWQFNKLIAVNLLKDSWPLIFSSIVITVYMKIDQVMIKQMLGAEAVGQYSAAVRLSEAWYFIPTVIISSIFPAIINAKKESEKLYHARIQQLYQLMVFLAVAIAIPTTFLSAWVIALLYGEAYDQAGGVLTVHIWSSIFIFLLMSSGRYMIIENYVQHALYRNIAGAISNIILNIYFIKEFGVLGAAYATLISYAISGFLYDLFNKQLKLSFKMKLAALNFNLLYRVNK